MARLNKDNLAQINWDYFQSLGKERLVAVAANLHQLAVEPWQRWEQNSKNSYPAPCSDNPDNKAVLEQKQQSNDTKVQSDQNPTARKVLADEGVELKEHDSLIKSSLSFVITLHL
ncbi:hypothetical protein BJP36_34625 [Moorena producens JHB]|uniref:Uncharacterized protein n=1 Tax=Moorena producens (strain JHB) TaxID=1454205 RepID=A0A1D9G9H7_MOOP1|nr:hypothetical protein [Moorena producens]AOY84299.1 hypothetical protein BJP36_34625 [Moorena producens JHB]